MRPGPLRILVIEDHTDTRDVLVSAIELHGYWVESCSNVTATLARLANDGFDVLLTDVRLPDGDAWNLLTELTKRGKRPPRVISMSAYDACETRRLSEASGCHGHLVKPFQMEQLEALLH